MMCTPVHLGSRHQFANLPRRLQHLVENGPHPPAGETGAKYIIRDVRASHDCLQWSRSACLSPLVHCPGQLVAAQECQDWQDCQAAPDCFTRLSQFPDPLPERLC